MQRLYEEARRRSSMDWTRMQEGPRYVYQCRQASAEVNFAIDMRIVDEEDGHRQERGTNEERFADEEERQN